MDDAGLTRDVFLDGRIAAWQPRQGYRAATDPLFLAAAVSAQAGQSVLELGCGAGVALLALGWRVPGLALSGVERQEAYAALARRNFAEAGRTAQIETADLARLPAELRQGFDHVMANPPYYPPSSTSASDLGRDLALREETPLDIWVEVALRRLKPGGWLTMIHLAERLPGLLVALGGRAGAVSVRPLSPREGRPAGRILLQARKGARGPFRLLAPLVVHQGARHLQDGDDFSPEARAILRDGAPLLWD